MEKTRLEAFSDGVIAIIITIMVLEMKLPQGADWPALQASAPQLFSYILSFLYIAIYWNNHHHLLHTIKRVNGAILWANIHLLFWLSLVPLATAWVWQNYSAALPTAIYGGLLLFSALAYYILQSVIIITHSDEDLLRRAIGWDIKGKGSLAIYFLAILLAFILPRLSQILYFTVALVWLVPDRRIEKMIK